MSDKKEELLVIGKYKNPRCFKGVEKLPVNYAANRNAWMTSALFEDYLKAWNKRLKRPILLLVDNATPQKIQIYLKNIEIAFLPANRTCIIQPCGQGIIKSTKSCYRREMRDGIIDELGKKLCDEARANDLATKTSLLDAPNLLVNAYNSVSEATIRNCFRKGGFMSSTDANLIKPDSSESQTIPDGIPKLAYDEWMAVDEGLETSVPVTEDDNCRRYETFQNEEDESEPGDCSNEIPPPPCREEVTAALKVLRRAVYNYGDDFNQHYR